MPGEFGLFGSIRNRGQRGLLVPAVFVLASFAVVAPIFVALLLAQHQSFAAGRVKAQSLALDVVRRADIARTQMLSALGNIEAPPAHAACSKAAIARMASAVLRYEQIQGAGYVRDGILLCTAAGPQQRPLPLGKAAFKTANGYSVRPRVKLPSAPDTGLILISAPSGYTLFLHPKLSLDLSLGDDREAIGVVGLSQHSLINQRGPVDTRLLKPFFEAGRTSFVAEDRLIAVQKSGLGDYAGFAMLPMDEVSQNVGGYLLVLLPIGLICGGGLVLMLRTIVRAETSFETIARRALRSNEFHLCYQPFVDLQTGRWIGAEALIRWDRQSGEKLQPDLFIPYLERAGLATALTDKVFELLATDVAGDLDKHEDFYVAVNLAAADLHEDRLKLLIDGLLARTGCTSQHFAIETTERGLIDAEHGTRALQAARARGIRVAVDDFGTGYSSLSYLQKFPLDYIKIDKSFVESIETQAATSSVVVHIINMAQDLKIGLIAEGVESAAQARFLAERGVASAQGWLFARPMSWGALMARLDSQRAEGREPASPAK